MTVRGRATGDAAAACGILSARRSRGRTAGGPRGRGAAVDGNPAPRAAPLPQRDDAAFFGGYATLESRGPWAAHALFREHGDDPGELAATGRARELRPWHPPAVGTAARLLQLLGRDGEALDLLLEAADHLQDGQVCVDVDGLRRERQDAAGEGEALERATALMPMLDERADRRLAQSMAARRSDISYRGGDLRRAAELADAAAAHPADRESAFWRGMADRMRARIDAGDADGHLGDRRQTANTRGC